MELATRAAKIGVFDWDIRTNTLYWSQEQYEIFGLPPKISPETYETWSSCLHPETRERTIAEFMEAVNSKSRFDSDFQICRSDGSSRIVRADSRVIREVTGEAIRVIGVNIDITEQRRVEAELAQARMQAEAGARAKAEFLANMSHEIRTPLNAIVAMADLAISDSLPPNVQEQLSIIASSANHLVDTVNNVLDLSKLDASKLEISRASINLRSFFGDIERMFRVKANEKSLDFSVELENRDDCYVLLDEVRVRQILTNLIGNALKFTPRHGRIAVFGALMRTEQGDEQLRVEVSDTGPGNPLEKQALIFEAFTQADSSTTRNFGGTGLGLSICKRLTELLDGELSVKSVPKQGATFALLIPVERISKPVLEQTTSEPQRSSLTNLRVLVAEDNPINQKVVAKLLSRVGITPIMVENGEEAVQRIVTGEQFDIILMDCQMPIMSGYEATQEIRLREIEMGLKPTIILAMTANALDGDRERCLEVGMNDYIAKPIRSQQFELILHRWAENLREDEHSSAGRLSTVSPH
ncbi:MAG: response regulator [Deltaproteobacteria bacterium]|nr:response regulator [Deltaproteobacteria bacterium]